MTKTWWDLQITCRNYINHSIIHDFYAFCLLLHLERMALALELILPNMKDIAIHLIPAL